MMNWTGWIPPVAVCVVETVEADVDTYRATDGKRTVKAKSSSVSA